MIRLRADAPTVSRMFQWGFSVEADEHNHGLRSAAACDDDSGLAACHSWLSATVCL